MAEPFLGELKFISFDYAPRAYAFCNGQTLPIAQNQALFSLLGTAYGGDGVNNFNLPNLQGRSPIHQGAGYARGQSGGEASHTLTLNEMPAHNHQTQATTANAVTSNSSGNILATNQLKPYATGASNLTTMISGTIANAGSGQAHNNMQPYTVLNIAIALAGIYPSRP